MTILDCPSIPTDDGRSGVSTKIDSYACQNQIIIFVYCLYSIGLLAGTLNVLLVVISHWEFFPL